MNKAQREEIYSTADRTFKDRDFIDREEFRQTFWEFAKRFEQIDPKPDPELYKIMFRDSERYLDFSDNYNGRKTFTKQEAEIELHDRLIKYNSAVLEYKKGDYIKYRIHDKSVHEFKVIKAR